MGDVAQGGILGGRGLLCAHQTHVMAMRASKAGHEGMIPVAAAGGKSGVLLEKVNTMAFRTLHLSNLDIST